MPGCKIENDCLTDRFLRYDTRGQKADLDRKI